MLVAAAAPFEVGSLPSFFAGVPSVNFFFFGIGSLEAARQSHMLREAARGKDVLFLGTCGSWAALSPVSLLTVDRVVWLPLCERLDLSWSLEGLEAPLFLPNTFEGLPSYTLLAAPTIAKIREVGSMARDRYELGEAEKWVENLELYTCVKAVLPVAKRVRILLACTNRVGLEGRKEWRENFHQAARAIEAYVRNQVLPVGRQVEP